MKWKRQTSNTDVGMQWWELNQTKWRTLEIIRTAETQRLILFHWNWHTFCGPSVCLRIKYGARRYEHESQCAYNVILRGVRVKTNQYYILCIHSVLSSMQTVFVVIWRYHIFLHCHTRHDCRGKKLVNVYFVLIFLTNIVWNISHSKKHSARYYHKCSYVFTYKYALFLSDFNETWILSTDFLKSHYKIRWYQISNFKKICPVGAKLFHTDGQAGGWTDGLME